MKKLALSALCAAMGMTAVAQDSAEGTAVTTSVNSTIEERVEYSTDKQKVETNGFWDNWFIGAGVGAQMYFGDHDRQAPFKDRASWSADITVGKWFSPVMGVRAMYSGLQQRGATKYEGDIEDSAHGIGEPLSNGKSGAPHWLQKQRFYYGNAHVDMLVNFTNLFCGYKPNRVYNCTPYLGIGWAHMWSEEPRNQEVSANVGVLNSFRLNDALDLTLDVRGMFVNDRFDGEVGKRYGEGMLSATVGLTYKFKERGWQGSKTVYRYDYGDLESMRERLNEISAENERLKEALKNCNEKEAETIVKRIAAANLVTFKINKWKLNNESRVNLGMLAEIIKTGDHDAKYVITGYADRGTGSAKGNERLSQKRAEAVYDCLVNEFGVSPSQLTIDYKGGVENMFYDDPRLSRAVITRTVEE